MGSSNVQKDIVELLLLRYVLGRISYLHIYIFLNIKEVQIHLNGYWITYLSSCTTEISPTLKLFTM